MGNQPESFKNIPGPQNINRFTLPNGITALTFNNSSAQSVNIFGLLDNGALLDPADKLGTAHFTAGHAIQRHDQQTLCRIP